MKAAQGETTVVGGKTRKWIVREQDCPLLRTHHLRHVEIFNAAEPFHMVRRDPDGSFLLVCFAGEGRILLDGRWHTLRAGKAGLAPPHRLNAFHAVPKSRWGICCLRYREPRDAQPLVTARSPVITPCHPEPMRLAIAGLYEELQTEANAAAIRHWVNLIHGYAVGLAQPTHLDQRLWKLWKHVEALPGEVWTCARMSQLAHVSGEHLRRLCRRQLGRSPMQQVTYLRIQHAAELLETSDEKIETISGLVGYQNPFVFSNTYKKWTGHRPSEYRHRSRGRGKGSFA